MRKQITYVTPIGWICSCGAVSMCNTPYVAAMGHAVRIHTDASVEVVQLVKVEDIVETIVKKHG